MDTTIAIILSVLVMGSTDEGKAKSITYEPPRATQPLIHAAVPNHLKLQKTRQRIALTNQWLKNDQIKRKQLARKRLQQHTIRLAKAPNRSCSADWRRT